MLSMLGLVCFLSQPAPIAPPLRETDEQRLMRRLDELPTERAALGTRAERAGLRKAEEHLLADLRARGLNPRTEEFSWTSPALTRAVGRSNEAEKAAGGAGDEIVPTTFRNVIMDFPGMAPGSPREVLIVAAHFDAVPGSPGADDNGTGVVSLLELADALAARRVRRDVRLIFFTLEEVGLIGSREYVKAHRDAWSPPDKSAPPAERVVGMISLEMLGFFSDEPGSQKSPIPKVGDKPIVDFEVPTAGNFIGLAGISRFKSFSGGLAEAMRRAEPELPVVVADFLPIAPPDFLRSDHAPFLSAGIPAVMLTDTANFRNPHYHTPGDTRETLDAKRWAKVTRAMIAGVIELADAEPPVKDGPKPDAEPDGAS